MNIEINFEGSRHTVFLYNFQFWNQRLFCLGRSQDGLIFKKFISTAGFDKLLMEAPFGSEFIFKKDHFNPYLCDKDKKLWKESQLVERHKNDFIGKDIGPHEFSGHYIEVAELGAYKDTIYFETKTFKAPEFDLYQYQNEDLYFAQYQSVNKDKLPSLTCLLDAELFDKINIIHGVTDENEDLFDLESVFKIVDTDLAFPEKTGLYLISKRVNSEFILKSIRYGTLEFYKSQHLDFLRSDIGNTYIRQVLIKKITKRKFALRYLYEYFNFTSNLMSTKRHKSPPSLTGPKEFKNNEFCVHFDKNDTSNFKIIYYSDVFTIERKKNLISVVPAQPEFCIPGVYDFVNSKIKYDDFENTKELLSYVRNFVSVAQSIKLAKLIGQLLHCNLGYSPRISKIHIAKKANSQPLSDNVTLYHVPSIGSDDDIYETETYVNAFEFLATFAIHISQVRNLLNMNWFKNTLFHSLQTTFSLYHVSRDYRRSLFNWDDDIDLKQSMIPIEDALRLIHLFESIGEKKNSYWYSNANVLLTTFPSQLLQPERLVPGV